VLGRCFAKALASVLLAYLAGSVLFVEFTKDVGDCLWDNGMIGGVIEVGLRYSGSIVV
jgi:hypothetical protein